MRIKSVAAAVISFLQKFMIFCLQGIFINLRFFIVNQKYFGSGLPVL